MSGVFSLQNIALLRIYASFGQPSEPTTPRCSPEQVQAILNATD